MLKVSWGGDSRKSGELKLICFFLLSDAKRLKLQSEIDEMHALANAG